MLIASRHTRLIALLLLGSACSNPGADEEMPAPPPSSGDCDSEHSACAFKHDFGLTTIKAGEERTDSCFTYKLDNPTDLLINTVELENDGAFHHSNWFFVPEKSYATEESLVRCHDIGFSEIGAALLGGVLFAQSTQS